MARAEGAGSLAPFSPINKMYRRVLEAQSQGFTIVTSSQRLARHLQAVYVKSRLEEDLACWEAPDILPWTAWLQRTFDRLFSLDIQLNPFQELALWEQIITESRHRDALLQVRATASVACDAWRLIQQWHLPWHELAQFSTPETTAFLEWAQEFQAHCEAHRYIDAARLPDVIRAVCEELAPVKLCLTGFDEITPQHRALLDGLRRQGSEIQILKPPETEGVVVRAGFLDATHEIRAAAHWARRLLERNNAARIAIVAPQLGELRSQIERIFEDAFYPHALLEPLNLKERAFNISLGRPLSDYPVIHAALTLLEWLTGALALEKIGELLRSPFWNGFEQEGAKRALLDVQLRKRGEMQISLAFLHRLITQFQADQACPLLAERLRDLMAAIEGLPKKQRAAAWVRAFNQLLNQLGWPGEQALNSAEYQAIAAWREALRGLSELDPVAEPMTLPMALHRLRAHVQEVLFQPESADAPVQILGPLDASGIEFDHLWLLGLQDEIWPPSARPNPLLPAGLQRRYGLPHASAERELEYAQRISRRLFASAPQVIVSYPRREGDRDLNPSPLIAQLEESDCAAIEYPSWVNIIHRSARLESIQDDRVPPLAKDKPVSGGSGLLKAQAACPFQALARYRLRAEKLEEASLGLKAMERGSLVHEVLEAIWNEMQSRQRLMEIPQPALQSLIEQTVLTVLGKERRKRPQIYSERFSALERSRLEAVALEWLELDRQRAPFTLVASEKRQDINLKGLRMTLYADRIDELEDGSVCIIDYKTGQPSPSAWFGERPDDPQLPLYGIFSEQPVAAVLFAQVKRGAMKYLGIAKEEGIVPRIKAGGRYMSEGARWSELFSDWRNNLEKLAEEIIEGDARVAPKNPPTTCLYCQLISLCRYHEIHSASMGAQSDLEKK